ncbi:UNVERIFIED_CONTAM: TIGR02594 family protein [Methylobacteriaceae bacterium AG10]|nr:TIGR02594 family protein [Methylobacteriaceae bacterium AG10]
MPEGISVHIGLNSVDADHYAGWSGPLTACEFDAEDMQKIAASQGFKTTLLLTKSATREAVTSVMRRAAEHLKDGDIFFMSYSGHGAYIPDLDDDEVDGNDETWCLYDGQLIDDEIFYYLSLFEQGVRILFLSDSCHSGSVLRNIAVARDTNATRAYRIMPPRVGRATYREHRDFYDSILSNPNHKDSEDRVAASAILISGCQDNQLSGDGNRNGVFTGSLRRVWNGGRYKGNYESFWKDITKDIDDSSQVPNLFRVGTKDKEFLSQTPFFISSKHQISHKNGTPILRARLGTIYTRVQDTFESITEEADITKSELIEINPHLAALSKLEPGIPIDVPEVIKRGRAGAFASKRARLSPYQVAREELLKGISEVSGVANNPRIVLYHSTTSGGAAPDEVSWCSSFVNFCVEQAGMTGTDNKAARSWHNKRWGRAVPPEDWQEGDIIVFWRGDKSGWMGHVGFLVSWQESRPVVLGGNQNNRISIASPYPFSNILSVRRAN